MLIGSAFKEAKDVQKIIGPESYYRNMDGTDLFPREVFCGRAMR